jgi:Na+/melibiose symporter-like transporter
MATKLALTLAIGIAFPALSVLGFTAGGANGPLALFGIAALYGLVPVAIKLLVVLLVWNFPLGASAQAELRARLGTLQPLAKGA